MFCASLNGTSIGSIDTTLKPASVM